MFSDASIVIASDNPGAHQARDIEFRATGNEPGWYLEISAGKHVVLATDNGQTRYAFSDVQAPSDPHTQSNAVQAANDGHRLDVILDSKPCMDSMSGE